jgi:GLPGLI family protein
MKQAIILFNLLVSSLLSYSQSIVIEYNHIISFPTNSTEAVYRLETKGDKSVYYQLKSDFTEKEGNEVIQANEGVIPFVIKDFSTKKTIYNQPIINSVKFITDELPMQVWTLRNETKKIKSFTCKKATTTFRGRNYTAWYTEELSIIGGPWKFDGLPGLILSVSSEDKVLNIEATKIEKKSNLELTKFDIQEDKQINWEVYCIKYRKVIERIRKNMKADSDPDMEYDININLVEDIGL